MGEYQLTVSAPETIVNVHLHIVQLTAIQIIDDCETKN
jgi:hypothetical protein